jgi:hypothetical protein
LGSLSSERRHTGIGFDPYVHAFLSDLADVQVHTLRDQLGQEARSRRSFIASSQAISHDVTELRRQLDQSLDLVSSTGLEAGLLDRESTRLQESMGRYTAGTTDYGYSRVNRFVCLVRFCYSTVYQTTNFLLIEEESLASKFFFNKE